MLEREDNKVFSPVAIFDQELTTAKSFSIRAFELCTMCGARFGIGYHGACKSSELAMYESDELPKRLTAILFKDHRQNRAHKHFIDLDF